MSKLADRVANRIRAFVDNPFVIVLKGLALLGIGLVDASHTFRDDLSHGRVRLGHGLVIIGVFSILDALPHLIGSMEAYTRYLELRDQKRETKHDAGNP